VSLTSALARYGDPIPGVLAERDFHTHKYRQGRDPDKGMAPYDSATKERLKRERHHHRRQSFPPPRHPGWTVPTPSQRV
jgi:hypothetical protein